MINRQRGKPGRLSAFLAAVKTAGRVLTAPALAVPLMASLSAPRTLPAQLPAAPPDLHYHLRITRPTTHLAEIEIDATEVQEPSLDFVLPAWSPGRYAIYDFAKNVQQFEAAGERGQPLPWTNPDKQTWHVETRDAGGSVRVRYRVFANDLNGSFSQVDSTHANLNGASVFMYVAGHKPDPVVLSVEAPENWKVISGFSLSTTDREFKAPSYDRLVDMPLEICGSCSTQEFEENGKTFRVAVHSYGEEQDSGLTANPAAHAGEVADLTRGSPPSTLKLAAPPRTGAEMVKLLDGLRKIVRCEMAMMPEPDFDHYTFIFHFAPDVASGDGMEHLNSAQIIIGHGFADGVPEALEDAAHEFFHAWNVKRLRPAALGPFDYTREDYTRSLWFVEGITSYYGYVNLLRSGIWNREDFLDHLAGEIHNLEGEPGRELMSAEGSSFHAWFFDRSPQMQETNFANSTISYYNKGALLGMLLDLEIRGRTRGHRSLDDVLRLMYQRFYEAPAMTYYLPGRGYEENDILEAVNEVSGSDFTSFFERCVEGTDPLPYDSDLAHAGLKLHIATTAGASLSIGALTQPADTGVKIVAVYPGAAADRAGLSRDDLLVAVDEFSLATESLDNRLKIYPPGAEVPFTVQRHLRRDRIMVKLDPPVPDHYSIEERPAATSEQIAIRDGWLGHISSDK